MPHALAASLQKTGRVVERRPVEEADVHMRAEGVDIAERGVPDAGRGMAVLQKLANIGAAAAHLLEPWLGDPPQLVVRRGKPGVDLGVAPGGGGEAEEIAHERGV